MNSKYIPFNIVQMMRKIFVKFYIKFVIISKQRNTSIQIQTIPVHNILVPFHIIHEIYNEFTFPYNECTSTPYDFFR